MHPILNYAWSSKKKLNKAMRESIGCVLRTMMVKRVTKAMKAGIVTTPERIYLTVSDYTYKTLLETLHWVFTK